MPRKTSSFGPWAAFQHPTSCVRAGTPTQKGPPPSSQPTGDLLSIARDAATALEPVTSPSDVATTHPSLTPLPSAPHLDHDEADKISLSDLSDLTSSDEEHFSNGAPRALHAEPEEDWDEIYYNASISERETTSDGEYLPDADGRPEPSSDHSDVPRRKNPPRVRTAMQAGPQTSEAATVTVTARVCLQVVEAADLRVRLRTGMATAREASLVAAARVNTLIAVATRTTAWT
ncbi:hypothetical protein C8T65DRAFT_737908 [Cerioporus squamosus]|nr:hypothetical protein C8T65DRAFT_737908 [Cerioporus squamosus]